jgi:hypothetical protein
MMRRFLFFGTILGGLLMLVPACSSDSKPKTGSTPAFKDQAPPSPKPAGKAG